MIRDQFQSRVALRTRGLAIVWYNTRPGAQISETQHALVLLGFVGQPNLQLLPGDRPIYPPPAP